MDKEEKECTEKEKIKSTAIVKYSVPKPSHFMKLKCNTDLNLPPSNWLSSSADSYGLQHVLYHQKGFSSFRMAHMFPDCVGEVDVVSDAENIKKLLKIPYSKGHVSMVVHRVENTLLLDDFDIYKHLLRTTEDNWKWLKAFFINQINQETCEEDRNLFIKNRRSEALKQKSLNSKFLYHSLVEDQPIENDLDGSGQIPLHGPQLPEPEPANPDSSPFDPNYNRNVVWTFEDIEMLIGTDMPIFGGGTHPCISLRLRDVSKPINVLTGIDYWLDNLMSNVPEVVMCYHLNGIVQKYELIKTEDLPRLDNSKFSPKLIRDVAQSILSFLKSNATKAGHTYWLFKGKDEEVVKLYDLSSLCTEKDVENGQNPFTIPVAMLLYRVARNMKHTTMRQPSTIRMLLKNCVKLLPECEYPEVVTSSHYMLADLYVPANTNPEQPGLETMDCDEDNDSIYDDDDDEDLLTNDLSSAMKVLVLDGGKLGDKFINHYKSPPPINGTVEERCWQAIGHISAGLNCLKYFPKGEEPARAEHDPPMAKPHEPIPMPFTPKPEPNPPKKKNKKRRKHDKIAENNALLIKNTNEAQPLPTWQETSTGPNIVWKDHLKTLLYEKAILVYRILSEQYFVTKNFGNSLRTIGMLARCLIIMNKSRNLYASNALKEDGLLARAGDCFVMIAQNWDRVDTYRDQFLGQDDDQKMLEQLESDERQHGINIGEASTKCVFVYDIRTIEQVLMKGIECYEQALKTSEIETTIQRLGNNFNEIATMYLNQAKMSKSLAEAMDLSRKAESYFLKGAIMFEKIGDKPNIALVYSNLGHIHRLLAHENMPEERCELKKEEKIEYDKAIRFYKMAMDALEVRETNPPIWDVVMWEMSTNYFNLANIMLENPSQSLSNTENENRVIEAMKKSLLYCQSDENNPKYPLYMYRAALIHYKLGSLYHNHIRNEPYDTLTRRNVKQLAKEHYDNAEKLYFSSLEVVKFLTSLVEKVGMFEFLAERALNNISKLKNLQTALTELLQVKEMLVVLTSLDAFESPEEKDLDSQSGFKSCLSLMILIKERLQVDLKFLLKLCSTKPPILKSASKLADLYRECYKATFELDNGLGYDGLLHKLIEVISQIDGYIKEYEKNLKN